jgi:hypothetical protein
LMLVTIMPATLMTQHSTTILRNSLIVMLV